MRKRDQNTVDLNKVLRAKWLAEAGFFEDPEVLNSIADLFIIPGFLRECDSCQVGDGPGYEKIWKEGLKDSLSYIIDAKHVHTQHVCSSGRIDIVMPLRLELLNRYSLWDNWCGRFGVRSIVVEVKNLKREASQDDVGQLLRYMGAAGLGHLGFLVSRNGFCQSAVDDLRRMARENRELILPLVHDDIKTLFLLSRRSSIDSMTFLRRKETALLSSAA